MPAIPPKSRLMRCTLLYLVVLASPVLAIDTLRVTTPDPFLESWRWSSFELGTHCSDVFEDSDGNIWFALDGAVKRYDGYVWTTYTEADGLSPANVRTIGQSKDGVMWFGTTDGVVRFNPGQQGKSAWRSYTTQDGLAGDSVMWARPFQSRDGTIWVGASRSETNPGGISRFDGHSWRSVNPIEGGEQPEIYWIHQMKDGRLWFLSNAGTIYVYDGASWDTMRIEDGFQEMPFIRMVETEEGSIWFARLRGLSRLDKGGSTERFPIQGEAWSLTELLDGTILSVTPIPDLPELSVFNNLTWTRYDVGDTPILGSGLGAIGDRRGGIWFWSRRQSKVHRLDYGSDRWRTYNLPSGGSLKGGTTGPNGSLWFFTASGAVSFNPVAGSPGAEVGEWFLHTIEDGLFDGPITEMSRGAGKPVWLHHGRELLSDGDIASSVVELTGHSRFDGRAWSRFSAPEVGLDEVSGTLKALDGADWLYGAQSGRSAMARYHPKDGWRKFGPANGLVGDRIFIGHVAKTGELWFGTRAPYSSGRAVKGSGVLRFDGEAWTNYTTADGLAHNRVYGLGESADGTIYVGSRTGVSWFDPTDSSGGAPWTSYTVEQGLSPEKPRNFVPFGDGIWFGYQTGYGGGVTRHEGGRFRTFTEDDGLLNATVGTIHAGPNGKLWAATASGVAVFDGTYWSGYRGEDGLPFRNISRVWDGPRGHVWFSSTDGRVASFQADGDPPRSTIQGNYRVSSAGNALISWDALDKWHQTDSSDLEFQWRINHGDWSPWDARRAAILTSLESGEHTFEVRARDHDLNVEPDPAFATLTVDLPWWQTSWVLGGTALMIGLILLQTARVVRRDLRLGRANAELEHSNVALSNANEDLSEANRALQRDRAVARIQGEVQAMEKASDFNTVLSLVAADLDAVGLAFDTCGIDVLDEPLENLTMRYFEDNGFSYTSYTIDPGGQVTTQGYHVPAPFPPVVQETVERFVDGDPWRGQSEGTTIVEVPASKYGRLRLTSTLAPYSDEDVDMLERFSAALALGYARYLDIRVIQEQTERKSEFLASMSHELRTPMNAIKGFVGLVLRRETNLTDRGMENLKKVDQASDHLLGQINDLLDLSKIEAGRMDVNPTTFDVEKLIASCVSTVSPLVKEHVALLSDVEEGVGDANTDDVRLRQMVTNLLSNAVKFTDAGEIRVSVTHEGGTTNPSSGAESGDALVIAVSDTGQGISPEALPTIFDEYRQDAGRSDSSVQKGTGLGLSITKKFSELLGGNVRVQSKMGEGTTFTITIPATYVA